MDRYNKIIDEIGIWIFDCDSTLSAIEGIDELAGLRGKKHEIESLTKKAMEGTVLLEEVFEKRLRIISPTKKDVAVVGKLYVQNRTHDTEKTIKILQEKGKEIFIVSGGYTQAVMELAKYYGIPDENVFAVNLFFDDNGNYAGFDKESMLARSMGKITIVNRLKKRARGKKICFVGDGASDLEVKEHVDLFIGYGKVTVREKVKENADIFIEHTDLNEILKNR
ncbi:MAG: HAD-IB family phosphatase [Nanoarchaeota archaeon]|nr:HAD-IB family phosphatase [Nanoarchaeota archaeon]